MCIGSRCGWVGEERSAIEAVEAALVHASAPPLCLEPRPAVGLLAAKLHAAPRLFNTPRIRRQARRFSQVFLLKSLNALAAGRNGRSSILYETA